MKDDNSGWTIFTSRMYNESLRTIWNFQRTRNPFYCLTLIPFILARHFGLMFKRHTQIFSSFMSLQAVSSISERAFGTVYICLIGTSIFQPADVGLQRIIKHQIKQSMLDFLVGAYHNQLGSGLSPDQVRFTNSLPILRDASVKPIVNVYKYLQTFEGSEIIKKVYSTYLFQLVHKLIAVARHGVNLLLTTGISQETVSRAKRLKMVFVLILAHIPNYEMK